MKAKTKEEKFLLAIYEAALASGDPEAEIDRYLIGEKMGLHPKGIDTICNQLAQANFIKKHGSLLISVTDNGVRLLSDL